MSCAKALLALPVNTFNPEGDPDKCKERKQEKIRHVSTNIRPMIRKRFKPQRIKHKHDSSYQGSEEKYVKAEGLLTIGIFSGPGSRIL